MTTQKPKWWEPYKEKKGRVLFVKDDDSPSIFMHYVSESTEKYKLNSDMCAMMPHMYRGFLATKPPPPPSNDWERRVRLVLE